MTKENVTETAKKVLAIALPKVIVDFDGMMDCDGTHITPERMASDLLDIKMEKDGSLTEDRSFTIPGEESITGKPITIHW